MRSLQPQIKAIQQRYAGDPERIQLETARLYKLAGINPLAGCLPTLITIPVWIGLYRALSNVANEGLLTEGFFWIPSLAGPTTVAARQNGSGISWLFPFVDGHPPLGWSDTLAYLVLPVLLVVSQYISMQIMQSSQPDDPSLKSSQAITKFLPLMIGYFALSVPSGLSLYWLTNNILSTAQQVWLQKMGGAKNPIPQLSEDMFKEEKQQPQKLILKEEQTQPPKLSQTEEVSPSTGLRPGERFKQLKEEEARRKRQREEAKMKAEEASIKAASTSEVEDKRQDSLIGAANGTAARLLDGKNDAHPHATSASNSSNGGIAINGNVNEKGPREDENTSDLTKENDRKTSDINDGREQLANEELGKEAVEIHSRMGSGEETS
uniref:Membrane insertase YidC/Oxa/ALB C-terminal domain-containing protein n=1 Tax=Opuntia streptacantha TaxID=393608 RepID=A0A7C9EIB6_OPUST